MNIKELREKSIEELKQSELLYKEELFNLRMQAASNQLEKPSRVKELRRGISRIKTLLREEEIKNPAPAAAPKSKAETKAKAETKVEKEKPKKRGLSLGFKSKKEKSSKSSKEKTK